MVAGFIPVLSARVSAHSSPNACVETGDHQKPAPSAGFSVSGKLSASETPVKSAPAGFPPISHGLPQHIAPLGRARGSASSHLRQALTPCTRPLLRPPKANALTETWSSAHQLCPTSSLSQEQSRFPPASGRTLRDSSCPICGRGAHPLHRHPGSEGKASPMAGRVPTDTQPNRYPHIPQLPDN
jgi:hypothetical protein